ncbi:MAG: hypothetical protein GY832_23880 [Chloroflexi bacterium]|nr:hypothetical protein [Chloroflexota bacterium]
MAQHIEKEGEIAAPIEKVYQVVADVDKYSEFLPGVKQVTLDGDIVEMTVGLGPTDVSWKSQAVMELNESIVINLVEGPFKQMDVKWEFSSVGDKTIVKNTTDFELDLRIPGIGKIAAKALEANTNVTIKAFRDRILSL